MSPRIAFHKLTREGLHVEVEMFENTRLLVLSKTASGPFQKTVQVRGIAGEETRSQNSTWYYEYVPLPGTVSPSRLRAWLELRGYQVGVFDQFGNFRARAA